jgi:hypothetical protein
MTSGSSTDILPVMLNTVEGCWPTRFSWCGLTIFLRWCCASPADRRLPSLLPDAVGTVGCLIFTAHSDENQCLRSFPTVETTFGIAPVWAECGFRAAMEQAGAVS